MNRPNAPLPDPSPEELTKIRRKLLLPYYQRQEITHFTAIMTGERGDDYHLSDCILMYKSYIDLDSKFCLLCSKDVTPDQLPCGNEFASFLLSNVRLLSNGEEVTD